MFWDSGSGKSSEGLSITHFTASTEHCHKCFATVLAKGQLTLYSGPYSHLGPMEVCCSQTWWATLQQTGSLRFAQFQPGMRFTAFPTEIGMALCSGQKKSLSLVHKFPAGCSKAPSFTLQFLLRCLKLVRRQQNWHTLYICVISYPPSRIWPKCHDAQWNSAHFHLLTFGCRDKGFILLHVFI